MTVDDYQDLGEEPFDPSWEKKRRHPRRSFRLCVKMAHSGKASEHRARDISLGGIFVETSEQLVQGQMVRLSLPFANLDRHIKMNGKVVRKAEDGVGVQFDVYEIDIG